MVASSSKNKVDFTEGKIFPKLIRYAIPIMLTGLLSTLYNATDMIVVGKFAPNGSNAMGAVGSCGALISLCYALFVGVSAGAGILTAQSIGAKKYDNIKKIIDTSIVFSSIVGLILLVIGMVFTKQILLLLDTPDEILGEAIQYLRSYSVGFLPALVYNFLASIVRSCGDSKSPLIFLAISGFCNVVANLIFVLVFNMGALGVGIGTTICQYVALLCMVIYMIIRKDYCNLTLKNFSYDKQVFTNIIRIGLPAGFQATFISISNVIIQTTINGYGNLAVSGNSAAANIEGFGYTITNAIYVSIMTIVGQNYGAKKYERIPRILLVAVATALTIGLCVSIVITIFGDALLKIYADDPAVREWGMKRFKCIGSVYFFTGVMEVLGGGLKGMGKTISSMLINLFTICGFRVLWIFTICAMIPNNIYVLYISYPVSQIITIVISAIFIKVVLNKLKKEKMINECLEGL